eukprot:CAMPEP_0168343588 /NCGR_PEP_ID=MMETSP0213-20121227/16206_1 /TAXON_ID=151035 /ORGANISM="Euplotes harpa, Strain FSP1.4" /LENGTH=57 /DNA_ID=CAMNT_0008350959 /DNA_START=30 /DNA_END=199 /DNA_ORIENTATION=-
MVEDAESKKTKGNVQAFKAAIEKVIEIDKASGGKVTIAFDRSIVFSLILKLRDLIKA